VRVREVLREAWRIYRRQARHLFLVALTAYGGLGLIPLAVPLFLGPFGVPLVVFFFLAGFFWLLGVLVVAVNDVKDGYADLTIRETVRRTGRRVNALGAAALFGLVAIAVGLSLVVVPGILLATWWALVVPVIVLERATAARSFRRSRWLVRGNGKRVFAIVLLGVLILLATWAGALAAAFFPLEAWGERLPDIPRLPDWLWGYAAGYVVLVVLSAVTTPFAAAMLTVAYFGLRDLRGPGPPVRVKLGVGSVLGEAGRLYTRYPRRLIASAVILFALLGLAELVVGFVGPDAAMFPVVFLVTTVGFLLLHAGITVALPDMRSGNPGIPVRQIARRVGWRFFRVLGAWLVVTFFAGLATVAFLLPGLVLLTYWSLITPVILLERKGAFSSLPRSSRLVGGNGLRVFAVVLPTVFVWQYSLGAVQLAPLPPFLYAAHVMLNGLLMPYLALAWTVAYYRLRDMPPEAT
jgi:hypothetical protein